MESPRSIPRRPVLVSVICLGVSSLVTQILVLREFLGVFAGNELVLGLILGNWLLLTGVGSFVGRGAGRMRDPLRALVMCQVAVALLPPLQLVGIRLLKGLFPPGLMLGIEEAFLASLILLLPYCLTAGFLLTLFAGMASSRRDARQIGEVYVLDALGGIAGGLLFSVCLVYVLEPFQTAACLLILNLLAALLLAHRARRRQLGLVVLGVLVASSAALYRLELEDRTAAAMFPGLELVEQSSTPYGNLALTRQGSQLTVFQNGLPIGSSRDPVAAEEMVHYALAQHPHPGRVLMLSGGLHGAHREIRKHAVQQIDYVELDPAVLELTRRVAHIEDRDGLTMVAEDARRFVKGARGLYDAVLMDLPDPSTAQLNRFYTVEFFAEVRRALRPQGVFSFGMSGAQNYASPQLQLMASAVYGSLSSVFAHVLVVPGGRMLLIASDRPLDYDMARRLQERGIETDYVNADYLAGRLTPDRIAAAQDMVSQPVHLNRDFFPVSYYAHLQYWLGRFGDSLLLPSLLIIGLVALVGVLLADFHGRPGPAGPLHAATPAAICASGFAGMGLEVVLLIAFQVTYGYVYQQMGVLVTAFLAGAALGAAWSTRRGGEARALMFRLDALLAGVALVMAPLLQVIHGSQSDLLHTVVPLLVFGLLTGAVGFLVGAQLPVAARSVLSNVEETAADLFTFDLLGASAGALVVGVFCLPFLGIAGTCYLVAGIKLVSAAALRLPGAAAARTPVHPAPRPRPRAIGFGLTLFTFVALGLAITTGGASSGLYTLTFEPAYHWTVAALLGWGIAVAMGMEWPPASRSSGVWRALHRAGRSVRHSTRLGALRWVGFAVFGVTVFYPVFRCFFSVPWLFCHVCPRPCVFGYLRPYLVPAALIMNLEKKHWCHHACPVGTLSHCQAYSGKGRRVPRLAATFSFAVLAFTAVSYFAIASDAETQPLTHNWYAFFYNEAFAVSSIVLVAAALLIAAGFRWRRPFCDTLCPVGTFSGLVLRLDQGLERRSRRQEEESAHAA